MKKQKIIFNLAPPTIGDTITINGIEFTVTKTIKKEDFRPFDIAIRWDLDI